MSLLNRITELAQAIGLDYKKLENDNIDLTERVRILEEEQENPACASICWDIKEW